MSNDIVERLREAAGIADIGRPPQMLRAAADEIERLRMTLSAAYEACATVADAEQAVAERALAEPVEPMTEVQAYLFEVQADTAADIATRIRLLGRSK